MARFERTPIELGAVYGHRTILAVAAKAPNGTARVLTRCICGKEQFIEMTKLRSGISRSCGCVQQPSAIDRFWAKVDKNGPIHPVLGTRCWLWTGATLEEPFDYGVLSVGRRSTRAHRFAWKTFVGPIPFGLWVLHHCDNPPCVNYERHLFLGTPQDNVDDMETKGRRVNPPELLNASQVAEIRALLESRTLLRREIAARFGISKTLVSLIGSRTRYAHIA